MTKRKKAKAATKSRKAKAKRTAAPKGKRPDGSISSGIYDQVEKLVADSKMSRAAAFRQIAKESGRKEGTVAVNYYYVAKKRGKTGRRAAKKTPAKPVAKAAKAPKSGGSISGMIYDAIEKLIAGGKMTRAAAFRQHAKTTGRKEGTVAVNYYYAAKKHGGSGRKRGPGRPKGAASPRRSGSASSIASVLKSLAELIRAQAAELEALRRQNARYAEIRRLVLR